MQMVLKNYCSTPCTIGVVGRFLNVARVSSNPRFLARPCCSSGDLYGLAGCWLDAGRTTTDVLLPPIVVWGHQNLQCVL